MAVTAGILKVVVSSYRIDSETALSVTEATLPVMMQHRTGAEKAPYFIPWSKGIVQKIWPLRF